MRALAERLRDERGSALVLGGISLIALLGMVALAVDLGVLYTARAESRRAADAAALAGVSAFIHPESGPAEQVAGNRARLFATQNSILGSLISTDEVVVGADQGENTVEVFVRRAGIRTWFARALGDSVAAVGARAVARAEDLTSARCVKPFSPPDSSVLIPNKKYAVGDLVRLRGWTPKGTSHAWVIPSTEGWSGSCSAGGGSNGGGSGNSAPAYARNICMCNEAQVSVGATYSQLPGNKTGPEDAAAEELAGKDPGAAWSGDRVVGSQFADWRDSPRVFLIPLHDPTTDDGGFLTITRFIWVFMETPTPGDPLTARFVSEARVARLIE